MLRDYPMESPNLDYDAETHKPLAAPTLAHMKTAEEFKSAREQRATDAIKVKDDQIKLLTEQNNALLRSLDKVIKLFLDFNPIVTSRLIIV